MIRYVGAQVTANFSWQSCSPSGMAIIGIVAVDRNLAIGKGGTLPWHYPADMKFFKQTTLGNAVVMGSRTWQTLKKPLPDRMNIVLSTKQSIGIDSIVTLPDV